MEVVGSEIGQKMRSAIKAKLTELGCYVDDELPDYVMVMVANKRTRGQMEDDLQLFLGDNTELFVNWLHQVLKKLQEVTVTAPLITLESEKSKERSQSKDKKSKEKKHKEKTKKKDSHKKSKKKDKVKSHKKKEEKKQHKSKKKSKHHEMIRPNVPPLLMNIEKESEPSITDVFAGQILKQHGYSMDTPHEEVKLIEEKPIIKEKRPIRPIIDPATISSQLEPTTSQFDINNEQQETIEEIEPNNVPKEDKLKEMNEIEVKIQGLKQKLVEQLDSMSDDEDFVNIRTEAEELMNDFAEDVFQEISEQTSLTSSTVVKDLPEHTKVLDKNSETHIILPQSDKALPEELPHIELNLPKRPVRERLGLRADKKIPEDLRSTDKRTETPERFTPEREPEFWPKSKANKTNEVLEEPEFWPHSNSAKRRLGNLQERKKSNSKSDDVTDSEKSEPSIKRLSSKITINESRPARVTCASVVRVRPRPRVSTTTPSLLLKAVADAHKSLLNIPPKIDVDSPKVKRALVLPMRRTDAQNIVIQIPSGENEREKNKTLTNQVENSTSDNSDTFGQNMRQKENFVFGPLSKKIVNTEYNPLRRPERTSVQQNDTLIVETINIHHLTVDKEKDTQFIVTMDGFNPNAFLAKKLQTEGLLDEDEKIVSNKEKAKPVNIKTKKDDIMDEDLDSEKHYKSKERKSEVDKVSNSEVNDKNTEITTEKSLKANKSLVQSRVEKVIERTVEERDLSEENTNEKVTEKNIEKSTSNVNHLKKRLSDTSHTSEESETQVIIKSECNNDVKRKISDLKLTDEIPPKRRKASPIVFDVEKKDKVDTVRERQRTESASSDKHISVTTTASAHKFDSVPPLSVAEKKLVWCRAFPACKYGTKCVYQHPRCKFLAACTRRGCAYSHAPNAPVASQVVPVANYKTITASPLPGMCKFYPGCVNPTCHYFHPKPCRFGKACANKLECNFYHNDIPSSKYSKYPV